MILRDTVIAIAEVQCLELQKKCGGGGALDNLEEIAADVERYLNLIPENLKTLLVAELVYVEAVTGIGSFRNVPPAERQRALRSVIGSGATTYYLGISWLVIFSRDWARNLIHFNITNSKPADLCKVPAPPVPDFNKEYDVCIIGSGAGGAMAAWRLGQRWKGRPARILMIEAGPWVSPDEFTTRHDIALGQIYKNGGAQPAPPTAATLLSGRQTGINVLQARVAGGGPTVNNAIQFPIGREAWSRWLEYGFPDLRAEMEDAFLQIATDFGIKYTNPWTGIVMNAGDPASAFAPGWRAEALRGRATDLIKMMEAMPVSLFDCVGCGGCNTGCRHGRKAGGVHDYNKNRRNGYLMRALNESDGAVVFADRVEAEKFDLNKGRVYQLFATRRTAAGSERLQIFAKSYILAAGPVASSLLLQNSLPPRAADWFPIGDGLTANVVTAMFAEFPQGAAGAPDPGTQMCYFTDPEKGILLESWFDYPGSLAIALNGDAEHVAALMKNYSKLSTIGVVVPVEKFGKVRMGYPTKVSMELGQGAFAKILRAIGHAAKMMYLRGAEKVWCGHRLSAADLAKRGEAADWVIPKNRALDSDFEGFITYLGTIIKKPADLSLQTAHVQSGNPVATSPARGVASPNFKVYGTSNLYIADSSAFPAGARVNPQMTAMALARIAADRVAEFVESGAPAAVER